MSSHLFSVFLSLEDCLQEVFGLRFAHLHSESTWKLVFSSLRCHQPEADLGGPAPWLWQRQFWDLIHFAKFPLGQSGSCPSWAPASHQPLACLPPFPGLLSPVPLPLSSGVCVGAKLLQLCPTLCNPHGL